jgi:Ca-activated chloride channel family protein
MKRRIDTIIPLLLALCCISWSYSAARKNSEGNRLYKEGKYEEALKNYQKAMTEAPEKPELYFNIGDALFKQSQFPEAVKLYERSAGGGKADLQSNVFYNIGNAKYRIGRKGSDTDSLKEAVACYERSLEINPNDMDAKYNLEFARRELKKLEEQQKKEQQKKEQQKKEQQKKEQQKKEQQKKEQEKKEQEKKEQQKKEQQKKEQEKKEQQKKEQEKKEQQKKEQQKKEQQKKEQEKKEQQKKEQQKMEGKKPKPQPAGTQTPVELTKDQAEYLLKAFEREQRNPADFIKAQIKPVPQRVEKDW